MMDVMREPDPTALCGSPQPSVGQRAEGSAGVAALVQRHQVGLWRYLRALGCDPDTADELVQETFLVVLRRPFLDHDARATGAFLTRTAYRLWLKDRRRRRPKRDVEAADLVWQEVAGDDDGDGWFEAVSLCLDALAPRARKAVIACHVEERRRADVAPELGLEVEGLKTLLRRAVATLRECVERRVSL